MENRPTRRKFVATLGVAGTASLAGCSGIFGGGSEPSPSGNDTTTTSPGTTSPTTTNSGDGTPAPNNNSSNGNGGNSGSNPVSPGELVDDFEGKIGNRWEVNFGKMSTTKDDAYVGSQSVVLEGQKANNQNVVQIQQAFYPEPLDLSTHDLSIAVKVEKPENTQVRVRAQLLAPAEGDMLTSIRAIPQEMNGWVRYDLGYTSATGNPVLEGVQVLRLLVFKSDPKTPIRVKVDDLRKVPKAKKGKIIIHFDDGHISAYENAFPFLKKKNIPAAAAIIPDAINADDRVSNSMMREMDQAGWEMMSHPQTGTPLPQLSPEQQERLIQSAKQALAIKGFKKGARHFVAPYNRVNATTLDLVSKYHDTGFLFGGCPNNAQSPSNPYFISRVSATDPRGVQQTVDMAAQFNQLAVITYHIVGNDGISMKDFRTMINYVKKKDVDVITPSQLID